MGEGRRSLALVGLALALLVAAGAAALWALAPGTPEDGPAPVVWDKTACAQCRMHVGEPPFAAQLHTDDGRVFHYDDPGCLFDWQAQHPDGVKVTWFHHVDEDRWIRGDAVGFVERAVTPMGYGVGAVDAAGAPLDLATARKRVLERLQATRGGTP